MLTVEKQGNYECLLSTIAALAGKSLAETRTIACEKAGVGVWADSVKLGTFWRGVDHVCTLYDPTGLLLALVGRGTAAQALPGASSVAVLSRRIRKLPAKGEGTVTVAHGKTGHIAPWCDGLVYDPNDPDKPMTLSEFRARHRHARWTVYSITYTK